MNKCLILSLMGVGFLVLSQGSLFAASEINLEVKREKMMESIARCFLETGDLAYRVSSDRLLWICKKEEGFISGLLQINIDETKSLFNLDNFISYIKENGAIERFNGCEISLPRVVGGSLLFEAIDDGDIKEMESIFEVIKQHKGEDEVVCVANFCPRNETPLWAAIAKKNKEAVSLLLLENKADVMRGHSDLGISSIFCASMVFPEIIETLIERGCSVNEVDKNGNNPLLMAAHQSFLDAVQTLLRLGADATLSNCDGDTPLHFVSVHGKENSREIVEALLLAKAIPDCKNQEQQTPLMLAIKANNAEAQLGLSGL